MQGNSSAPFPIIRTFYYGFLLSILQDQVEATILMEFLQ